MFNYFKEAKSASASPASITATEDAGTDIVEELADDGINVTLNQFFRVVVNGSSGINRNNDNFEYRPGGIDDD